MSKKDASREVKFLWAALRILHKYDATVQHSEQEPGTRYWASNSLGPHVGACDHASLAIVYSQASERWLRVFAPPLSNEPNPDNAMVLSVVWRPGAEVEVLRYLPGNWEADLLQIACGQIAPPFCYGEGCAHARTVPPERRVLSA